MFWQYVNKVWADSVCRSGLLLIPEVSPSVLWEKRLFQIADFIETQSSALLSKIICLNLPHAFSLCFFFLFFFLVNDQLVFFLFILLRPTVSTPQLTLTSSHRRTSCKKTGFLSHLLQTVTPLKKNMDVGHRCNLVCRVLGYKGKLPH